MSEKKTNNLTNLILSLIGIGGPVAFFATWIITKDLLSGVTFLLIYFCLIAVSGIATRVWDHLEDKWSFRISDWIDKKTEAIFSRYQHIYLNDIFTSNRLLSMKGMGRNRLPYYLQLSQVYIPLKFGYFYDGAQPADAIDLLDSIQEDEQSKFVVIGDPGCGKSTLLKFLALELISNKQKIFKSRKVPNKLPILLQVAHLAQFVSNKPSINLPTILEGSLISRDIKIPEAWFREKLTKGRCVILFDGLDEIADFELRRSLANWAQRQIDIYPKNSFIITSRPHGYTPNPLTGVTTLEIKDFDWEQIEAFCQKWYLANESVLSRELDDGIISQAKEGANKLIRTLANAKELANLAENPLLLTMIATVYSIKENLPRRRVDLYKEIVEVSIERLYREDQVSDTALSTRQKTEILEILAYFMMENQSVEIDRHKACKAIEKQLKKADPNVEPDTFINIIKNESDLLLETEEGKYVKFAHKTFQEYLASTRIQHSSKLKSILLDHVSHQWWSEVIRLYAAQVDATLIIERCFLNDPPTVLELSLAISMLAEGLFIEPKIRNKLKARLNNLVYDTEPQRRNLVAQAHLSSRIRFLGRINPKTFIDDTPLTNIEYQLFLDDMAKQNKAFVPDHWLQSSFVLKDALKPVTGVRAEDAFMFCNWLTEWDWGPTEYCLPSENDVLNRESISELVTYWITSSEKIILQNQKQTALVFKLDALKKRITRDFDNIKKLNEAFQRRKTPPETTTVILARIVEGTSQESYYSKKRSATPIDTIMAERSEELFKMRLLLEADEVYSAFLGLDINTTVSILSTFITDKSRPLNLFGWLPGILNIPFNYIDIGSVCDNYISFLGNPETRRGMDDATQKLLDPLINAINRLRDREWAKYNPSDQTRLYDFLRWYIRVILIYFLSYTSERIKTNINFLKTQNNIIDESKKMFFSIYALENRIQGFSSATESIRVLKREKLFRAKREVDS